MTTIERLDAIWTHLRAKNCVHYPLDDWHNYSCEACLAQALLDARQLGLDEGADAAAAAGNADLAAAIRAIEVPVRVEGT